MANYLIVDDNADETEVLSKLLAHAGHTVDTAPNGREALAQVLAHKPDVVLLDLLMPVMDGPSFLKVIRSYLRLQSLPVVVLTALSESPLIERARTFDVKSVLVKCQATSRDMEKALEEAVPAVPG